MKKPCRNCPFRTDKIFPLSKARRSEIADALFGDSDFPCHKTTGGNYEDQNGSSDLKRRRCTGAAIFLQNARPGGLRSNISFRLAVVTGEIVVGKLDLSSPVVKTYDEFVNAFKLSQV